MIRLDRSGDTIVEVLIAMAVISLVLVGAYVATNQNLASTQDAQERSQAVKLAETQVESIRSNGADMVGHCLSATASGTEAALRAAGGAQGSNPCIVDGAGVQVQATAQPAYTLTISKDTASVYLVDISWDAVTGTGQNNVKMYYAQPE